MRIGRAALGVLLCLLFLSCRAGFAAAPATLSFYDSAAIAGPDILLGDIAAVTCADEARAARLRALKLGNAPPPGGTTVFSARLFQLRFLAAGGRFDDVAWSMARPVEVRTRAQQLTGAALVQQVEAFLAEQLRQSGETREYSLAAVGEPRGIAVPEGAVRYECALPYGIHYTIPSNVTVLVYVNEQLYKKSVVRMKVRVYEAVVVAARALRSRQTIAPEDVRSERRDAGELAPGYFTDTAQAVGKVMRRTVTAGTPLAEALVDKPVLVERQAAVQIVSTVGGVQARMEGEALQDGREGDWIRVKNTKSGRILSGKVIDATTVEVAAK